MVSARVILIIGILASSSSHIRSVSAKRGDEAQEFAGEQVDQVAVAVGRHNDTQTKGADEEHGDTQAEGQGKELCDALNALGADANPLKKTINGQGRTGGNGVIALKIKCEFVPHTIGFTAYYHFKVSAVQDPRFPPCGDGTKYVCSPPMTFENTNKDIRAGFGQGGHFTIPLGKALNPATRNNALQSLWHHKIGSGVTYELHGELKGGAITKAGLMLVGPHDIDFPAVKGYPSANFGLNA